MENPQHKNANKITPGNIFKWVTGTGYYRSESSLNRQWFSEWPQARS